MQKRKRIVLTGGPGGGKTTAADLLRRELGSRVVIVPEAATILFAGGFPRVDQWDANRAAQSAIFHVQRNLEDVQSALYPDRTLLCDRGTVDGAAYWHDGAEAFFHSVGTTLDTELSGLSIEGGNPVRRETLAQAVELDGRLRALWSQHPRFTLVEHNRSFLKKIMGALGVLERLVDAPNLE